MGHPIWYLIVFQLFCGVLSALIAHNQRRNRVFWLLAGALLPVVGIGLILLSGSRRGAAAERGKRGSRAGGEGGAMRPPKRCCGSYIPDCEGCPFFRKPLFDERASEGVKGWCRRFNRDLRVEPEAKRSRVVIEEDDAGNVEER